MNIDGGREEERTVLCTYLLIMLAADLWRIFSVFSCNEQGYIILCISDYFVQHVRKTGFRGGG